MFNKVVARDTRKKHQGILDRNEYRRQLQHRLEDAKKYYASAQDLVKQYECTHPDSEPNHLYDMCNDARHEIDHCQAELRRLHGLDSEPVTKSGRVAQRFLSASPRIDDTQVIHNNIRDKVAQHAAQSAQKMYFDTLNSSKLAQSRWHLYRTLTQDEEHLRELHSNFELAMNASESHRHNDANRHIISTATAIIKHCEHINRQLNAAAAGRSIARKPVVVHKHADGAMPIFPHDDTLNEWAFLRNTKTKSTTSHAPAGLHGSSDLSNDIGSSPAPASRYGQSAGSATTAVSVKGTGSGSNVHFKHVKTPRTSRAT